MITPKMFMTMALKEYELLRTEVVSTVERQYSLQNWGLSAIAVVIGSIISAWQTVTSIPGLFSALLVVIIPAMVTTYAISWSHTISKLNQLGIRLYDIESNIALLCGKESLYIAFNISSSSDVWPYRYTLGWEHLLWKDGVNKRIQTTIYLAAIALAAIFLLLIVANFIYLLCSSMLSLYVVCAITVGSGLFWGAIWFGIFRYLHCMTVDSNIVTPKNASTAA